MEQINQEEYLKIIEDWKLEHKEEIDSGKCRKCFTEILPRCIRKGVDWENSIGIYVYFIYYKNIEGYIKITNYNKKSRMLTINYNDRELDIFTTGFARCQLGKLLGEVTGDFKIEIGQTFKDDKRDITTIDRKKIGHFKYYKYKCNKCGFNGNKKHYVIKDKKYKDEYWILESSLLNDNGGCACCCNQPKIVVENINSIYHTDKWMLPIINDEEFCKIHTHSCRDKVFVTCPDCGCKKDKKMMVNTLSSQGVSCPCSDKIPYTEKLMFSVLEQLGINFQTQLSKANFKWCQDYRYDFYISNLNIIIETHGLQHYEECTGNWRMNLNEVKENDKSKKKLALQNCIGKDNYIVIDCRYSNLEYIKQNILNSRLNKMFDLNKVDWSKAGEYACSNLLKLACEYKRNNPDMTTGDIGKIMGGYVYSTVIGWLRDGSSYGWCNYDAKEEMRKAGKKNGKLTGKPVEIFKDGISLGVYESCHELERRSEELFGVKLKFGGISVACNKESKKYKGYTFKYISKEEYEQRKEK